MTKRCSKCRVEKSISEFHVSRRSKDGHLGQCKDCRANHAAEYYVQNSERYAERQRKQDRSVRKDQRLQRLYGITERQYQTMFKYQKGRCAICRRTSKSRRLEVDHSHKTGLVRGLLCWRCNHRLLGSSEDNPELLRSAALYLEESPAVSAIGVVIAPQKPKRKGRYRKTITRPEETVGDEGVAD